MCYNLGIIGGFYMRLMGIFLLLVVALFLNFSSLVGLSDNANTLITVLVGLIFVIAHGSATLGWRNLLAFLLITTLVSFAAESIGVATGWIFGHYYYTDLLGPKILGVPPVIQVAYAAMGYASLMTARIILNGGEPFRKVSIFAVPIVATFIMVSWDVAMDPYQSTVAGDWIWQNGGPYFGVGIHNYVGWFGTVFAFLFLYQLYSKYFIESAPSGLTQSKLFWSQPVLYYAIIGFGMVIAPLTDVISLPYASPQNYSGSVNSLQYSLALIAFFIMGSPSVIALARLL